MGVQVAAPSGGLKHVTCMHVRQHAGTCGVRVACACGGSMPHAMCTPKAMCCRLHTHAPSCGRALLAAVRATTNMGSAASAMRRHKAPKPQSGACMAFMFQFQGSSATGGPVLSTRPGLGCRRQHGRPADQSRNSLWPRRLQGTRSGYSVGHPRPTKKALCCQQEGACEAHRSNNRRACFRTRGGGWQRWSERVGHGRQVLLQTEQQLIGRCSGEGVKHKIDWSIGS